MWHYVPQYLNTKCSKFKEQFNGEDSSEENIAYVQKFCVPFWLSVEFHS